MAGSPGSAIGAVGDLVHQALPLRCTWLCSQLLRIRGTRRLAAGKKIVTKTAFLTIEQSLHYVHLIEF